MVERKSYLHGEQLSFCAESYFEIVLSYLEMDPNLPGSCTWNFLRGGNKNNVRFNHVGGSRYEVKVEGGWGDSNRVVEVTKSFSVGDKKRIEKIHIAIYMDGKKKLVGGELGFSTLYSDEPDDPPFHVNDNESVRQIGRFIRENFPATPTPSA